MPRLHLPLALALALLATPLAQAADSPTLFGDLIKRQREEEAEAKKHANEDEAKQTARREAAAKKAEAEAKRLAEARARGEGIPQNRIKPPKA